MWSLRFSKNLNFTINMHANAELFMLFNWIPLMAMLITPRATTEMEKMAILAIMTMADGNFIMAVRGI